MHRNPHRQTFINIKETIRIKMGMVLKFTSMINQQRAGSGGKPVKRCDSNYYLPFYAQVQILGKVIEDAGS